jgi:hypothetical protein
MVDLASPPWSISTRIEVGEHGAKCAFCSPYDLTGIEIRVTPGLVLFAEKPSAGYPDRLSSIAGAFDSIFKPCRGATCDSKDNPADQSGVLSRLIANSSFTNQRADSFSPSGVNLEAKV